jgi:hypothetical protein
MAPKVAPKTHTREDLHGDLEGIDVHSDRLGTNEGKLKPTDARSSNRRDEYTKNKSKKDQFAQLASIAALGLTLAIAAKIAAAALNNWLATNGAKVQFTSIAPDTPWPDWLPDFFVNFLKKYIKSKKLKISYTVTAAGTDDNAIPDVLAKKTDVRLTKYDTISVDAGTTGLSYLDGQTISIDRVVSQGTFIFNANTDVSNVYVTSKGTGTINSSYDQQLGEETYQTASDIESVVSRTFGDLFNNMGSIIFYILIGVIIYLGVTLVSSLR